MIRGRLGASPRAARPKASSRGRARRACAALAAILALFVGPPGRGAPGAPSPAGASTTNRVCPVTPGEPIDPTQFVEVDGRRVYFCCAKCRRQYLREPEKYAQAVADVLGSTPQAGASPSTGADASDPETGHTAKRRADEAPTGLVQWIGRFHPASTNFPVAMLLGAVVAEGLLITTGRSFFEASARYCLWFGAVGALGSAILGWCYAGVAWSDGDWVMTTHRWLGTAVPAFATAALVLRERWTRRSEGRGRWWYRIVLVGAAAAASFNGFLGGALVYGLDHYAI